MPIEVAQGMTNYHNVPENDHDGVAFDYNGQWSGPVLINSQWTCCVYISPALPEKFTTQG